MTKNDGGPAFPHEQTQHPDGSWNQTLEPGMSLRDWFAGMAMQGILTLASEESVHALSQGEIDARHLANASYAAADSMLKARQDD